jgi:Tol biopolymer transport system component
MELKPGAKLGPYEIVSPIGKGGMGEVWMARDPRLGRDVAIKISAQQFTDRFEREARAIASLNHPNICTLFDVGPNYLVMESIEGPTLAERIKQGPVPLEEALALAMQIADALDAAHEKGIVHRDLKPANIKIRPDGSVKVLDFGLAKSIEQTELTPDSPTMLSAVGMILGTAGYMSPEQARGQEVDKRADIWAFGVVLYEMLTARRLFEGKTVSDALAAVLMLEPEFEWAPAKVQRLLRACLQKDTKNRLHDIADWKLLLEENAPVATAPSRSRLAKSTPWMIAGALFLAATGLGGVAYRHSAEPQPGVLKLSILPPGNLSFAGTFPGIPTISPDGRRVAFSATAEGKNVIWVRDLDSLTARPLPGTDGGGLPFWSPDSRTVGFFEGNKLKKIDVAGGPVLIVCDAIGGPRGGTWANAGKKEVILFAVNAGGIFQVPASGGTATSLIKPNPAAGELNLLWPWLLPDGRHFLYSEQGNEFRGTLYVADLESGRRKRLLETSFNAGFASGMLLFVRDGNLLAQPFDPGSLETTGDAVPVAEAAVGNNQILGVGFFSASRTGVLAYLSGAFESPSQLTWFDRSGKQLGTVGPRSEFQQSPAISPDGSTVAINTLDAQAGNGDIWLYNLSRGAASRFTFGPSQRGFPIWSPDGTHLAFTSQRDGPLHGFQKALNGGNEESLAPALGDPPHATLPEDWSRDGRYLVERVIQTKTKDDIWIQPLATDGKPGDRKAFPYLDGDYNERNASISPDGKWIVYSSDETGRTEVYSQAFPSPGGKVQISTSGGERPRWSRDGKEIYYIAPDRKMMAVPVRSGATLDAGQPQALFNSHLSVTDLNARFDVSKDGRFLIPVEPEQSNANPLTVIVNWPATLRK